MKILVLEDEAPVMRLMRHMLRQYSTIEAATREQALRRFRDNGSTIGLLIADVTLPVISGLKVAISSATESRPAGDPNFRLPSERLER